MSTVRLCRKKLFLAPWLWVFNFSDTGASIRNSTFSTMSARVTCFVFGRRVNFFVLVCSLQPSVRLFFLQAHRETDRFFAASGVQSAQTTSVYRFRRAAFLSGLKSKVGLALAKTAALRIVLNLDGAPIASKSHTHPSHSETSRLLTSSLSLRLPVPRPTQCVRGA
jgi:hypothetical protein